MTTATDCNGNECQVAPSYGVKLYSDNINSHLSSPAILSYYTSGNLGHPKEVCFSRADWKTCVQHRADYLQQMGIQRGETVATMISFGPWFSGDNIHDALLQLGTRVLPVGIHPAHRSGAERLMRHLGVSTIITTPSLALALADTCNAPKVKKIILIGENATTDLKNRISQKLQAKVKSLYAATEAIIGFEDPADPSLYCWDPNYLDLHIITSSGDVALTGKGELLVTKKYGDASPIKAYRLGDIVELFPAGNDNFPKLRFLGRTGHAFSLSTGVEVSRAQLDRFLDDLELPIKRAHFSVQHLNNGTDTIEILLATNTPFSSQQICVSFCNLTLDIADLAACGALHISATRNTLLLNDVRKRKITISENPWQL